ncbi:hsp70 nucleotide exchange factor fes1 [Thoreauomyces humboldtii]|nr:hsp70 nucleotide exchange factor fes1 [Thoreauomyces humboldtii]
MTSSLAPARLASTTYWARSVSKLAAPTPAKTGRASVAAHPARSVAAHLNGVQLISTTNFTANNTAFSQKRFYAAPVYEVKSTADVTSPPREQDAYKIQHHDNTSSRNFAYFMVGSLSFVGAAAAKNIVTDYLVHFAASADVLAMAKVEVDMASVPEGKNVILKWRGKPVFIRHRTADEIAEANSVALSELRDPETDADRTKKPEWLVMLGVCTHLGCVPIGEAGEYGGWFCPCHGSHYDISGRIRKGPAPLNLEVPVYDFNEADGKIVIG